MPKSGSRFQEGGLVNELFWLTSMVIIPQGHAGLGCQNDSDMLILSDFSLILNIKQFGDLGVGSYLSMCLFFPVYLRLDLPC